jgi:hypothetical protein
MTRSRLRKTKHCNGRDQSKISSHTALQLPILSNLDEKTMKIQTLGIKGSEAVIRLSRQSAGGELCYNFCSFGELRMLRLLRNPVIAIFASAMVLLPARSQEQGAELLDLTRELPKGDADGFVTIVGGDDLKVWKGLPNYWYVKDGILGGHQTKEDSKQTFLVYPFILRDFELHLKYKFVLPQGNSGIQFRSKILDQGSFSVGGYQADMDASGDFDGSIYDEAGIAGGARGTLSARGIRTTWTAENQPEATKIADSQELKTYINVGDWNDVVLIARGNHITYSINGHVMTELIDESPRALREGVLALQLHEGFAMDIQFRDGKIRQLDNSEMK